jgi:hypothetical protein
VRVEPEPVPAGLRIELDLLDVEAEPVQTVQPLVEPEALVGGEHLLLRQLVPQCLVARDDLGAGLVGVEIGREPDLGVHVEELADDVQLRDVEVVRALPVGELAVQLSGLRVDEIRRERARVATEERVRERAVAPEEAAEMQAGEQLGQPVQQVRAQVRDRSTGEERAVGERVLEVPRDQHGAEVVAATGDEPDRLDHRQSLAFEPAEQRPLSPRRPVGQLLERVERAVVLDESNDVPADPADQRDETWRAPVLQRLLPGQVEEARVPRARGQLEHRGQRCSSVD